jgi:hypothetical protein
MIVDANIGTYDKKLDTRLYRLWVLNDHKDVFNVFTNYTQLSRLLEYAIECGQHIQANKEGQKTLWSSTQEDINEIPFMIHSTQDFYNKSIIILKFFHMGIYTILVIDVI